MQNHNYATAPIQMVDLKSQYLQVKNEIDAAIANCINSANFINGPEVKEFASRLEQYLDVAKVVPCANGTDALQIALMALDLKRGDEIIVPAFTYVATAEVIGLLGLVPVIVDVDPFTFNITAEKIRPAITEKTKAIVPVHLFGQCADMDAILQVAHEYDLFVVEDTAQAIGARYTSTAGNVMAAGTMGHVGCTSFFPSKNLGCYGDGGALFTDDTRLGANISMIANHGQEKKYVHKCVGVNSRLDSIQAAILNIKLSHLDRYSACRQQSADIYDQALKGLDAIETPVRSANSTHVFHQYTLKVKNGARNALKAHLASKNIPSMIYYPVPLNMQEAYKSIAKVAGNLDNTVMLCQSVLSLPMHSELTQHEQEYIINSIIEFFN